MIRNFFRGAVFATGMALFAAPVLAASSPPGTIQQVASTAAMQAIGTSSPLIANVYVNSLTAAGLYSWTPGACVADGFVYFQATGISQSVGCWKFTAPSWAFGGSTLTGGALFTGSIGVSSLNGQRVIEPGIQVEASNAGLNVHAGMDLADLFDPFAATPVCTITGSVAATTNTLVVTSYGSGCTALEQGQHISGAGVPYATAISSGSTSPYTLNRKITAGVGSETLTIYPARQEAAYITAGLTSTGGGVELANLNATWTNNDNTNSSGVVMAALCANSQNGDGSQAESCPILVQGGTSGAVLLGSGLSGGDYPSLPIGSVTIFNNLGSTVLNIQRTTTSSAGVVSFTTGSTTTSSVGNLLQGTDIWNIGMDPAAAVGASDFTFFNKQLGGGTLAMSISNTTNQVSISGQLSVGNVPTGSGGVVVCVASSGILYRQTASAC